MALGIPWLLEREYRRHRMLDAEGLPETFDAWQAMALAQTESGARAANIRVVKVVIHPAELEVWARQLGRKVNDQARSDFAEILHRTERGRGRA